MNGIFITKAMVYTVSEALSEYESYAGKRVGDNTRSLIKKHILSELLPALGFKKTQKAAVILDQLPIAGFVDRADPIFQQRLLAVENSGTRKVMRSEWKRVCGWLQKQARYSSEPVPLEIPSVASSQTTHFKLLPVPKQKEKSHLLGLQISEFTPRLKKQLQEFKCFEKGGNEVTKGNYLSSMRNFLGWRKNVQNIPVEDLDFSQVTDLVLLKEYRTWLEKRGLAYNTVKSYLKVAPAAKYFVCHQQSPGTEPSQAEIDKLWGFIDETKDNGERPRVSDGAYRQRELSVHQLQEVVVYLGWRCKDLEKQQGLTVEVTDAWMDYLIIAILLTTAVRQREVRELCLSRLVLSQGLYSVVLKATEHKTGGKKEKGRGYPLFVGPSREELCKDLAYYIERIRPKHLEHDCLFFLRGNMTRNGKSSLRGNPISSGSHLSSIVPALLYRVTAHLYGKEEAKATQCHDFRRIKSTWICSYSSLDNLPKYAEMLGMSRKTLEDIYARLHPGALAAQVPFANEETVANEIRMTGKGSSDKPGDCNQAVLSHPGSTQNEKELLRMTKVMWSNLSKARREGTLEVFSPLQRQLLEVSRTVY